MLERENAFYKAHQAEFREKYLEKWLVIAGDSLIGVFNRPKEAVLAAREQRLQRGEFMLHRPVDDGAVLEVGPMGIIKMRRPYAPKKPKANPVITTSGGELMTIPYV